MGGCGGAGHTSAAATAFGTRPFCGRRCALIGDIHRIRRTGRIVSSRSTSACGSTTLGNSAAGTAVFFHGDCFADQGAQQRKVAVVFLDRAILN